jgi:hypothetical protein
MHNIFTQFTQGLIDFIRVASAFGTTPRLILVFIIVSTQLSVTIFRVNDFGMGLVAII